VLDEDRVEKQPLLGGSAQAGRESLSNVHGPPNDYRDCFWKKSIVLYDCK
jgi:hypothetical protein